MKLNQTTILILGAATGVGLYALLRSFPSKSQPKHMAGDDDTPPPEAFTPGLDESLSQEQAQAVGIALATEQNAGNLQAFSNMLLPDFPIASGLLKTKAKLLGGA